MALDTRQELQSAAGLFFISTPTVDPSDTTTAKLQTAAGNPSVVTITVTAVAVALDTRQELQSAAGLFFISTPTVDPSDTTTAKLQTAAGNPSVVTITVTAVAVAAVFHFVRRRRRRMRAQKSIA